MPVITLVERIDALLPQTQCGQCSHSGCRPYAEALADGRDPINRCPPGGDAGIRALAELLGRDVIPFAADGPQPKPRALAVIREDSCIGCTLCIQACPVDAIVGAAKQMHTVIAAECTGCELCLTPCPVDCIDLVPVADPADGEREQVMARAAQARIRYQRRLARKERDQADKAKRLAERAAVASTAPNAPATAPATVPAAVPAAPAAAVDKNELIRKAMERAAAMRAAREQADKDKA